jgi:hypothetical protein
MAFLLAGLVALGMLPAEIKPYATGMAVSAGVYLLAAASVARAGAERYPEHRDAGVQLLVLFLGMAAVFLAMFLGIASILAEQQRIVPGLWNASITWSMLVFGIGSYAVELVYLLVPARRPSGNPR